MHLLSFFCNVVNFCTIVIAAKEGCKYQVYVYNFSKTSVVWDLDSIDNNHLHWKNELDAAFGKPDEVMPDCMRSANQNAATRMTEYQLLKSPCRTINASEADLFFAPVLLAPKLADQWRRLCQIDETSILKELIFLTPSTACRHFIFFAKTFRACSTGKFWYDPNDLRLWQIARLAHDMPLDLPRETNLSLKEIPFKENFRHVKTGLIDRCISYYGIEKAEKRAFKHNKAEKRAFKHNKSSIDASLAYDGYSCFVPFPHIYSVPYPSSIHWPISNIDPIASRFPYENRTILISFIGNVRKHSSSSLRKRIHDVLVQYNCSSIYCHLEGATHGDHLLQKGNSVFCLEPGGDSPSRKSISDSIAFGCIPVTFGYATAQQYSDFWNSDMRVDISIRDMMHGPDTFLLDYLKAIANNKTLLTSKRRALDKVKKRFTYSTFADHNDAVDIILDLVHRHASHLDCASSWRKSPSTFFHHLVCHDEKTNLQV